MRAHERRGITKADVQRRINRWYWARQQIDERGWVIPFSVAQGMEGLSLAGHYRRRLHTLRKLVSKFERDDHLNNWRHGMKRSRICAAPPLP